MLYDYEFRGSLFFFSIVETRNISTDCIFIEVQSRNNAKMYGSFK